MFDKIQFRTLGWKKFFLFSTCIHWIAIVRRRSPWKGFQRSFLSLQRELRRPMYSFLRFTVRDGNKYKINRLKKLFVSRLDLKRANCKVEGKSYSRREFPFPPFAREITVFGNLSRKWNLLSTRRYWDVSRVVWLRKILLINFFH